MRAKSDQEADELNETLLRLEEEEREREEEGELRRLNPIAKVVRLADKSLRVGNVIAFRSEVIYHTYLISRVFI